MAQGSYSLASREILYVSETFFSSSFIVILLGQLLMVLRSRILKIKTIFNKDKEKMAKEVLLCEYKCM